LPHWRCMQALTLTDHVLCIIYVARGGVDAYTGNNFTRVEQRLLPEERILIVDNERSVLSMAADALRALGYLVVVAESGQDAMAIVGRERFDLVMAGETLPDLDAAALIQRTRSVNPNTRAIIMTERHNAGIVF
jgi:PleD family two-component response regulator